MRLTWKLACGVCRRRAAADALRRVFLDEKDDAVADTVKMRLDRLEKREVVREREIAIVKETLLLFIRVWLEHTPPPREETLDATNAVAERRFNPFLNSSPRAWRRVRRSFHTQPMAAAQRPTLA
ncbi:MAG: hypothetical protein R3C27_08585 [Hyphomonadaceae bacterium]